MMDLREKKRILEKKINSELRKRISNSSMCTVNMENNECHVCEVLNLADSEPYLSYRLEWDVYDLLTEEYDDDNYMIATTAATSQSFFDTRHMPTSISGPHNAIFENFNEMDDIWQTLILRAEGLWAFGHTKEACFLVKKIAEHILSHPPDLKIMCSGAFVKPKRRKVLY